MGCGKGVGRISLVRRVRSAGLLAGLVLLLLDGSALARADLHVIPFPGTPDASPGTAVIFSSLAPADLRSVRVTGSRSGAHVGRLEALPDSAGTAFVPDRAFRPGEQVHVLARLSSGAAGTAAGDPGATQLAFSFAVAVRGKPGRPPSDGPIPAPQAGTASSHSFHSAPGLHPPPVSASSDPDTTSGDIFLTPAHTHQKGPMILNSQGKLVWFRPVKHAVAFNLEVQSYHGQRVLTWWQGRYGGGGQDVILDSSYRQLAALRAGHGYDTDPHEFQVNPQGTAWVMARTQAKANLSGVGGPSSGTVWDSVIQKLAIPSGKVLWEWHAYGHIPLSASHKPPHNGFYDCYHLNSIQQLSDGNLLVSSRSTWSVYKINTATGRIVWTLGGKYSNFHMGPGTQFEWQHDAHRLGNTLTLFDDAAHPEEETQSSAKVLALHMRRKTVTLIHRYTHKPPLLSPAQGSVQILANGNVFVGWGSEPDFSEYSARGKQIFAGSFALGTTSYRSYRFSWHGQPSTPPHVAAAVHRSGARVWASWNGATNVARWRVLGGASPSSLHAVKAKADTAFETRITLSSRPRFVEVQALNAHGKVLGTSSPKPVG